MFSTELKYYHGTSQTRWEIIQKEKRLKPSHLKKVGHYWITKGVYFVCENPFIALWYAHVAAMHDKSDPIVVCINYSIDQSKKNEIVNLLTSDGHTLLSLALNLYKKKLYSNNFGIKYADNENLDSFAFELLMAKSKTLKGVIACFQEGKSYQSMIVEHQYTNKYVPSQNGFSPGDHVEICFYPHIEINNLSIKTLSRSEILSKVEPDCDIWDLVCQGLTEPIENLAFKKELYKFLKNGN